MRVRCGGGQVVSMLAFYPDNPCSNTAEAQNYLCKICVWKEQKEDGEAHLKNLLHWIPIAILPHKSLLDFGQLFKAFGNN